MQGRRRPDQPFAESPDDLQPGDYWKYLHPDTGEPMKPYSNIDSSSNLTQSVWGYCSPSDGGVGILVIHTVREEEDGTISVRQGDGSSNSILYNKERPEEWHGYIEHGVWRSV